MKLLQFIFILGVSTNISDAFSMENTIEKYKKRKTHNNILLFTTKEFIRIKAENENNPKEIDIMRIKNKQTGKSNYHGIKCDQKDSLNTNIFENSKLTKKKWLKLRSRYKNQRTNSSNQTS